MSRVYNFSAGPAVLPEEVLKEAADEMLDYKGSGMSVMEMSHRSKVYDNIIKEAEQDLRDLMNIPDNYKVLFLQGGASQQFAAVPMNLMKNKKAGYIVTGQWAKKAYQEAQMYGEAIELASSADQTFSYIPDCSDLDIPEDADFPLPDQYHNAIELIGEIKEIGDFCIGGACYPEGHPEAATMEEDLQHLKEKVEAGCDYLTTQMFFDNNIYYRFLYKALAKGINVPVVPGIMPVTNAAQVKRTISLTGNLVPAKFLSIVDRFGSNPEAMKQAGIAYATEQIIDLIANGVNHIHIYSMNKPDVAGAIMDNLSKIYVRK